MYADDSDIQTPSNDEKAAMQATKYITSHGASQHTGTYMSDVINRTYNQ
jgi:hypothetical protein